MRRRLPCFGVQAVDNFVVGGDMDRRGVDFESRWKLGRGSGRRGFIVNGCQRGFAGLKRSETETLVHSAEQKGKRRGEDERWKKQLPKQAAVSGNQVALRAQHQAGFVEEELHFE